MPYAALGHDCATCLLLLVEAVAGIVHQSVCVGPILLEWRVALVDKLQHLEFERCMCGHAWQRLVLFPLCLALCYNLFLVILSPMGHTAA